MMRIRRHVEQQWEQRLRRYHASNLATARRATENLVRDGWHLGPVPYGYRPRRVRVASTGRCRGRTSLVIEPVEATVVKMIYVWRVHDRLPVAEITRRLNGARYPAPLDPHTGQPRPWRPQTVRAILRNPKYTGYQVWGRRHGGRPVPPDKWVWSHRSAHPPIVEVDLFRAAQPAHPTESRQRFSFRAAEE